MDRSNAVRGAHLPPAVVAALMALAMGPLLLDHVLFHPDERHYLDGGLQMLEGGDWLTPRTAEGQPRLHKPVLAYWCVAAGGALFGPSPFSTRILFLLAAAGIVWWSARGAAALCSEPIAGPVTALMLAIHPALLINATRSLPDILLTLGITIALTGMLELLSRGRAAGSSLGMVSAGTAMAILAKGTPGLVFALHAGLFLIWRQRPLLTAHPGRFLTAALGGLVVPGAWFFEMYRRHGDRLVDQFLTDQGSPYRFVSEPEDVVWQAMMCLLLLMGSFAAVLLPGARTLWQRRKEAAAVLSRPAGAFLASWIALFLAAAACLNHVSLRYLLPIVPATAMLLCWWMLELDAPSWRENLRRVAWGALGLLVMTAGLCTLIWRNTSPLPTLLLLGSVALVLRVLWRQMRFTSLIRSVTVMSAGSLASLLIVTGALASLGGPSFGRQVADAVQTAFGASDPLPVLTLIGEPAHAARIRVCSGGRLKVHQVSPREAAHIAGEGPVAVLEGDAMLEFSHPIRSVPVPCGWRDLRLNEIVEHLWAGDLVPYLRSRRRNYLLAIPAEDRPHSPTAAALPRLSREPERVHR